MRSRKAPFRRLPPDLIYGSPRVAKFINMLMRKGKKSLSERIVYAAFDKIKQQSGREPLPVFEEIVRRLSPLQEVRSRRVGGANYQVPLEVRGERRVTLALRWLIQAARNRSGKAYHTMEEKLASEMLDVLQNTGEAVKKKENIHKMAEANRAFAHFRW